MHCLWSCMPSPKATLRCNEMLSRHHDRHPSSLCIKTYPDKTPETRCNRQNSRGHTAMDGVGSSNDQIFNFLTRLSNSQVVCKGWSMTLWQPPVERDSLEWLTAKRLLDVVEKSLHDLCLTRIYSCGFCVKLHVVLPSADEKMISDTPPQP